MSSTAAHGDWSVHQDDQGRTFYYNASSGQSSWTRPESLLPEGWSAHTDSEGNTFYHNTNTGSTQWEYPSVLAADAETVATPSAAIGTTSYAIQSILQLAASTELVALLGHEKLERVCFRAQCVQEALALPVNDSTSTSKLVGAVRDLAKLCLRIRAFNTSACIAETIAATTAAVAGVMEPGIIPGGKSLDSSQAVKLIQVFAECHTTMFLLDAATKLDIGFFNVGHADASAKRIRAAFSGSCAWLLTAFCRAVGYDRLTADTLWEWANFDPMWVAVLTKGTLTLDEMVRSVPETPLTGPMFPPEYIQIRNSLVGVFFGLLGHNIAFHSLSGSMKTGAEVEDPNMRFAKHWSKIALAVIECDLLSDLLPAVQDHASEKKSQVTSFVAKLLQPELQRHPPWAVVAPELLEAAMASASNIARSLQCHSTTFWSLLTAVAIYGNPSRSFLKDCSEIAFCFPVSPSGAASFIRGALGSKHQFADNSATEPFPLTALCMIAANADIIPACEDDGGLSQVLSSLPPDSRVNVLSQFSSWTGSVSQGACACWTAVLQGSFVPPATALPRTPFQSFTAAHRRTLGMASLAPPELCCAIDHMLLDDPVRSPFGHSFEFAVLDRTLSQNSGMCPITDKPLSMNNCSRDDELRQRVCLWLQQRQWA